MQVNVVERSNRRYYQMEYTDPLSGRVVSRSTGIEPPDRRGAEKVATQWETEISILGPGRRHDPSWEICRTRFTLEYLPNVSDSTAAYYRYCLNSFERHIGSPDRMSLVTASVLSRYAGLARVGKSSVEGVRSNLRGIRCFLRWLHALEVIPSVPAMPKLQRVKGSKAKGRAVSDEEFEAMLAAVPEVVPDAAVAGWTLFLRGLWLSGLRLTEAVRLQWCDTGDPLAIIVDRSGKHPMFSIGAWAQKNRTHQLCPMAPEFARLLDELDPDGERVFSLYGKAKRIVNPDHVGRIVCQIGKAANVIVSKHPLKYASAHDLRRSFGTRWAGKVSPQHLMGLMRHSNITTTLDYYASDLAEQISEEIWNHSESAGDGEPPST